MAHRGRYLGFGGITGEGSCATPYIGIAPIRGTPPSPTPVATATAVGACLLYHGGSMAVCPVDKRGRSTA